MYQSTQKATFGYLLLKHAELQLSRTDYIYTCTDAIESVREYFLNSTSGGHWFPDKHKHEAVKISQYILHVSVYDTTNESRATVRSG